MAFGIVVESSRFELEVGPATSASIAVSALAATLAPESSVNANESCSFSPGSMCPSPLFVPASLTEKSAVFRPGLTAEASSGCRCPPSTVRPPSSPVVSNASWQSLQFELSGCGSMTWRFTA